MSFVFYKDKEELRKLFSCKNRLSQEIRRKNASKAGKKPRNFESTSKEFH